MTKISTIAMKMVSFPSKRAMPFYCVEKNWTMTMRRSRFPNGGNEKPMTPRGSKKKKGRRRRKKDGKEYAKREKDATRTRVMKARILCRLLLPRHRRDRPER